MTDWNEFMRRLRKIRDEMLVSGEVIVRQSAEEFCIVEVDGKIDGTPLGNFPWQDVKMDCSDDDPMTALWQLELLLWTELIDVWLGEVILSKSFLEKPNNTALTEAAQRIEEEKEKWFAFWYEKRDQS